ncbi:hypothetical protein CAUP111243_01420 [Campylobacter upsaliensis]|uniref:DUF1374 domain-containing protein n=1 Tax=Campylobacter upsaliensis TaxID=28080 RepID=A0A3S5EMG6_CAMUP|nr:hypothetical protein [Campylobacter upsaliensis]MCA5589835.1 hypothetical protein [Campylobacter upsaliensis]MCA5589891.1 hypothetical protein [Campylobacter upsaliensis]VEG84409.1 Uncharacterised protein [Campylobacter upsaliensis]
MFSIISTILGFFKGNMFFYISLALALGAIGFLTLSLEAQKARYEKVKNDLNISLEANYNLALSLETLKLEHKKQIEAISEANEEKEQVKERIEYVNRYIVKKYESGENNLTKLFNAMANRLWEQNWAANR